MGREGAPERRSRTPRIGVVALSPGGDAYERAVIAGIVDAVRAQGASVLCFAVAGVESDFDAFVGIDNADAFVILSTPLLRAVGKSALEAFCGARGHVPCVSVGLHLSGAATIRADGRGGVKSAVMHLVEAHGRRRIGFVRESETSLAESERFAGYEEGLAEAAAPFDPLWSAPCPAPEQAAAAIQLLFDERNQDLDAVVTFSDAAALATVAALIDRGKRVPEDVAVIGYHDVPEADQVIPPLTTVTEKLHEQGWRAARLVLAALEGHDLPDEVILETELVVRRSCGCFPQPVLNASGALAVAPATAVGPRRFEDRRSETAVAMTRILGSAEASAVERLLTAFASDLERPSARRFLSTLEERLNRAARSGDDLSRWEDTISTLRRLALPLMAGDEPRRAVAEDLWHEARVLIADAARRTQIYGRALDRQDAQTLGAISQSLITAKDLDELRGVLSTGLPPLGVKSCHVSLYDARDPQTSTLVLSIEKGDKKVDRVGSRFPSGSLAPEGVLDLAPRVVVVILPLSFKGEQLGVILLEANPSEVTSYEQLRAQFGALFKRMEGERELARLHDAQRERMDELERAHRALRENQEKLLISERMASLGRLTAGMAHEMNTPLAAVRAALGEMVNLIDEYRSSVGDAAVSPSDHLEIAEEMATTAKLADSAAQKVAGFVRGIKAETRDLSSHEFCHFDPVPVIEESLLLLGHAARSANCTVTLECKEPALDLFGSPARLSQVVTNLVTNAIDASREKGGGPVALVLAKWERGLELRVTDQGAGIAPENLGKIFYPMYTTKPFGLGTGLGLAIVHDIVSGDWSGTIEVDSRVGEGTSFVLRLPSPDAATT